jgi:hypothetical protein
MICKIALLLYVVLFAALVPVGLYIAWTGSWMIGGFIAIASIYCLVPDGYETR